MSEKSEYFIKFFFILKSVMTIFKISRKVLNEKILNYNVLGISRDKLREYAIKSRRFHLRN